MVVQNEYHRQRFLKDTLKEKERKVLSVARTDITVATAVEEFHRRKKMVMAAQVNARQQQHARQLHRLKQHEMERQQAWNNSSDSTTPLDLSTPFAVSTPSSLDISFDGPSEALPVARNELGSKSFLDLKPEKSVQSMASDGKPPGLSYFDQSFLDAP